MNINKSLILMKKADLSEKNWKKVLSFGLNMITGNVKDHD